MWKVLIAILLPILAYTDSFVVVPEDEVIKGYKSGRGFLTPEQEEFLMELLAADDALIEATSRGIVDDILQALSGSGSNIRVNIIGGSTNQQQQQPLPAVPASATSNPPNPAFNIINPTFTLVSTPNNLEKALINSTDTTNSLATDNPASDISSPSSPSNGATGTAPSQGSISVSLAGGNAIPQGQQMQGNVTTVGGNNNHLLQTISQVIRNSNSRNVTGIVDESLRIATPAPIREFVTGILNVVYCNGIRRLLGRC